MRFWIILGILGFGLAMLLWNHQSGRTFGLGNDDFAQIVQLSAIAALLATGFLVTRGRISETLRNAALWLLIMLVFVAGYVYRDDLQSVAGRMTAGLVPGRAVMVTDAAGEQILVLHKMDHGHFQANVQINGGTVPMLVDTGASAVVLSYADAERLGLQPETLDFNQMVSTANGTALAAPIRLDSLAIGPIERRNVRAMVAGTGRLEQSLLGMSFLGTLGSIEIRGDELRLRD
ncbi:TIGR02281 family clan AA aspartic protease [Rhizobium sp. TRM96647]|uniref:retropepsin-like aspartic protease family protein n=1 Tax=unclassified Rhizobium TaxID=2613769 RepID=UPI0021E720C8|nr:MULTISPECIES: TIGR02281 family clan AA aspartic protease [unclassified Rhizobium]MCV3737698.1 TIGR02281 family clan AA aspartic protease [Rhizobium sp. TRM96647]MCV3759571.1 TIGR02281 family clan AA aspartic protease [Rhizobium sp. TRM96650]